MADTICLNKIKTSLAGCNRIGSEVRFFKKLGSTNDKAAEVARAGNCDGLVIIADHQLSGRGRGAGRRWVSPAGKNILMSIVLDNSDGHISCDESLVMASGLAVAAGCEKACGFPENTCKLKWPNDVLVDGLKLAGILIERCSGAVVIGMGINVNFAPRSDDLRMPATCLADICKNRHDRNHIICSVLGELDFYITQIADNSESLISLRKKWTLR